MAVQYQDFTVSDEKLRETIERISAIFSKPVSITSGDRDYVPKGGSKTSLHLAKRAADFHVIDVSDEKVFRVLLQQEWLQKDFEVIRHGDFTATGGPHIHVGRYGDNRPSQFKVEGTTEKGKGIYLRV